VCLPPCRARCLERKTSRKQDVFTTWRDDDTPYDVSIQHAPNQNHMCQPPCRATCLYSLVPWQQEFLDPPIFGVFPRQLEIKFQFSNDQQIKTSARHRGVFWSLDNRNFPPHVCQTHGSPVRHSLIRCVYLFVVRNVFLFGPQCFPPYVSQIQPSESDSHMEENTEYDHKQSICLWSLDTQCFPPYVSQIQGGEDA